MTEGRGPDGAIDAVGMEAHGAPVGEFAQKAAGLLPDKLAEKVIEKGGIDRMSALYQCFDTVRRGGTVSISGVYGGMVDPIPMLQLFDKGVQLRMGQAHVKKWIDELMPLVTDDADPLGTQDLASHKIGMDDIPDAYEKFQKKEDGAIKFVIQP
jgi:threonine dehydrogenase-like Zn-dependent dehydrogenase